MNKLTIYTPPIVSFLFVLFFLPLVSIGSDKVATLPYDRVLQLQDTMIEKLTNDLPFYLHIFSTNPKIKDSDISLHLVAFDEKIEIPLDKRGFIELPIRRDLIGKGAYIVSNQPKGTMALRGESRSQVPLKNRKINYKDLISPVIATNSVRNISKDTPEIIDEKYVSSINLYVDYNGNEPVIIAPFSKEKIQLTPDACGNISIPINDKLLATNPIVKFPSNETFYIQSSE